MITSITNNLDGKVIIVTGAGGGIGRACAVILSRAGAYVILSDVVEDAAEETLRVIQDNEGQAELFPADLTKEKDIKALVEETVKRHGRLDGAFNNAGISQVGKILHELTTDDWQLALRVDLTSVFWCLKYQVLAMMAGGGGAIVNTASSLGQVAIPNASEYIAAKHGVVGLTRAAAADYGKNGIRVNAVLPGIIRTPMVEKLMDQSPDFSEYMEKLKSRHPIGRFGEPSEIGEATRWLLSNEASFVNGAAFAVDGGYLAV